MTAHGDMIIQTVRGRRAVVEDMWKLLEATEADCAGADLEARQARALRQYVCT